MAAAHSEKNAALAYRRPGQPNTLVEVGSHVCFGGEKIVLIGGPCAVESQNQITDTAKAVAKAGAAMLRGGAWKPRTSPYDFQGLKEEGLVMLAEARKVGAITLEVSDTKVATSAFGPPPGVPTDVEMAECEGVLYTKLKLEAL